MVFRGRGSSRFMLASGKKIGDRMALDSAFVRTDGLWAKGR